MTAWTGTLRPAADADGLAIGKLYANSGLEDGGVDWTEPGLAGWWLVAEREGELEGAVQMILSRPWAYVADIVVEPRARGSDLVLRMQACVVALARQAGAQKIVGFIEYNRPDRFGEVLSRMGWADAGHYTMHARAI